VKHPLLTSLLLALLLTTPALAGIGKGNGEIGFDFGVTDFGSNLTDKTGARLVFRGGYHFTDLFELEGEIGCASATESSGGFDTNLALCAQMVNGVLNFHLYDGNLVVYLLGGLGSATLVIDPDFFASVDDSSSAYQIAVGGRFFFGEKRKSAFRAELSRLHEETFDIGRDHTSLVAGFTWRLGRGK
jgi:Outer membrane protein beta-barrel domain